MCKYLIIIYLSTRCFEKQHYNNIINIHNNLTNIIINIKDRQQPFFPRYLDFRRYVYECTDYGYV